MEKSVTTVRINNLPLAGTMSPSMNLAVDSSATQRATIQQVVDAGAPVASQADAEAGVDNVKRMTPLTTKQAIAALGVQRSRALDNRINDTVSVKDFGPAGEGSGDDTSFFQLAVAASRQVEVPPGTYDISTIYISNDTTFYCKDGAVFRRKAGLDIRQSYWNPGTAMFEVVADGLTVKFMGSPVFDGNKANQPVYSINPGMAGSTTEPAGWAFKYQPVSQFNTLLNTFYFENAEFKNGTSGYILVRAADNNRRFRTKLILENCTFTDTVRGYGRDDPATPTALGWNSDYINIMDYVELLCTNLDMKWSQIPTPLGVYAPVGVRATFFGQDYLTSGQAVVVLSGRTKLQGLGRKDDYFNDPTIFTMNNGIGAIDCYGNTEMLYVEDVYASDCENIPLRAKGSIKRYTVLSGSISNCRGGLQVSPSSTGPCEADIFVGSISCDGGWLPQLEFNGTSVSDTLRQVHIGRAAIRNATNGAARAANISAGAYFRNAKSISIGNIAIYNTKTSGLLVRDIDSITIEKIDIDIAESQGVAANNVSESLVIRSGYIKNTGLDGIIILGNTNVIDIDGVYTYQTTNYGIQCNTSASAFVSIRGCRAVAVAGTSRGFYFANQGNISNCSTGEGVATPLLAPNIHLVNQVMNSWNPRISYASSIPVSGTWARGDIVWNTAPAASGFAGWECVSAGSPGVWKSFGPISA